MVDTQFARAEEYQEGDGLLACLLAVAHSHGRSVTADALIHGLPLEDGQLTPTTFHRAASRAGLSSRVVRERLRKVNPNLLPAILLLEDDQACILWEIDWAAGQARVSFPELDDAAVDLPLNELSARYTGKAILARPNFQFDARTPEVRKNLREKHWFWGVIAENRRLYRDVLLAAVMINLFAVAMPLFVMNVYDRVVPNQATETLWVLAAGVFLVLTCDLVLRVMRASFVDLAASRADVKLSSSLMERVLGMRMEARPQSTGSFAAMMQSFESVRSFIGSATVVSLVDLPFVLLFVGIIALIGWPLIIPILVGGTVVLLYGLAIQSKMHSLSEKAWRAGAQRNATLVESLNGLETIKTLGAESRTQLVWERTTAYLARTAANLRLLSASVSNGATWAQHTVGVSVIIIGVYLIMAGELSQGGLIAAYLLSSRAMAPISQTAALLTQYHQASTALESLDQIMQLPVERPEGRHPISRDTFQGDIAFRGVSFRYPSEETDALTDVSFRIKAGEHVAILGRTGSGKTTLQKLVLGLYQPTSGTITIDGVDLRQLDTAELRRNVGYVSQDIMLFHGTLRDNIAAGAVRADDADIIRAAEAAGLARFVNSHPMGFDMPVGERGQQLSGGQRQAVALARALLHEPPMLLLDEPTGSMDNATEEEIKGRLGEMSKGRTLVVVTHRTSLLALVDRIIVVDAGRIVADGPKDQVVEALRQGRIGSARS